MLQAFRRDTLQWENIPIKGRYKSQIYDYADGIRIDYASTLALKGSHNFTGLGICRDCGKIMTRKQYDKHLHPTASIKRCADCNCCEKNNIRIYINKDGKLSQKGDLYCEWDNEALTRDKICRKAMCSYAQFIEIDPDDPRWHKNIFLPKKILTFKAFEGWNLERIRSESFLMSHPCYNSISARFDINGYLIRFNVGGNYYLYDDERDEIVGTDGVVRNDISEVAKDIIKGVYKNAVE